MLTPKAPEVREAGLIYWCKVCNRREPVSDNRVYVNLLKRTTEQSYLSKRNVGEDPTLERQFQFCESCERDTECVRFLAPTLAGEESFKLMFECTYCRHQWVSGETNA
jgi:DNA-directed RNA polymerase subunit M/transcription elongation factor TFIIS